MTENTAYRSLTPVKAMAQLKENGLVGQEGLGELVPEFLDRRDFYLRELRQEAFDDSDYRVAREEISEIFKAANPGGFAHSDASVRQAFDDELTHRISGIFPMTPYEASQTRVWSYITLRVLPDFAMWRFPNRAEDPKFERYLGSERNTFKRLWWRAYMIGPERAAQLAENDMIQMFERGRTIGSSKVILETLADRAIELKPEMARIGGKSSDLISESAKRIKRELAVVSLDLMSVQEARQFIEEKVVQAFEALSQARTTTAVSVVTPASLRRR